VVARLVGAVGSQRWLRRSGLCAGL